MVFYPNSFLLYEWTHGSNCTLEYWFQSLVFQKLQLFARGNSMQLITNTRMMRLQMRFQVMIAMNVPSMMHWIVGDIKVKMWWNMWMFLWMKLWVVWNFKCNLIIILNLIVVKSLWIDISFHMTFFFEQGKN